MCVMKKKILQLIAGWLIIQSNLFSQALSYSSNLTVPQNTADAAWYFKPTADLQEGYYGAAKLVYINYAVNGMTEYHNLMYVPSLYSGQVMLLRILLPPGTKQATIFMESNDWICSYPNCAVMRTFNTDPGTYCNQSTGDGTTCGSSTGTFYYNSDLSPASGGDNATINSTTVLPVAQYFYFVLYNGLDGANFTLGSMSYQFNIMDTALYSCWRAKRPWAGGPASNSWDGIGETCTTNINDMSQNNNVEIFPNPTDGKVTVNCLSGNSFSVQILSMEGQILKNEEFSSPSAELSMDEFNKGVYLIRIQDGSTVQYKKLFKQ
ncbi:MAG: hypothetical protein A2309_13705 [Bacteroidetes bacterium RIFOXYB2_FULL_35_7]|nr:MAG: hypothetical protein A2309_13705 [Bacteroidetes bacterium RIFOXYB2_FULL_35_7]